MPAGNSFPVGETLVTYTATDASGNTATDTQKVTVIDNTPPVVTITGADPLVHDRISLRLARFIAEAGPRVVARAPRWKVPTLLMYAGSDHLVDPEGSRAFCAAAPRSCGPTRRRRPSGSSPASRTPCWRCRGAPAGERAAG